MKSKTVKTVKQKSSLDNSIFLGLILFVFAFLLYSNTIKNAYNIDDELVTRNHPLTSQGLKAIPDIIKSPYYKAGETAYEYRPTVLISFAIEHQFFGENAHTSHFINVLLYAISIWLMFVCLKKLLSSYNIYLPFVVALIFAAHPLHTEVVASIKNRDEILSLLFSLWAWILAWRYVQNNAYKSLCFSIFAFLVALLSKSSAMPFAFIIPFSLLLFSKTSSKQVLFLSLGLSMAAGFLAPFYNFSFKVFFALLILVSPFLLSLTLNKRVLIENFWLVIKNQFVSNSTEPQTLKTFTKQHIVFFVGMGIILCSVGLFYNFRPLIFVSLVGLIPLYFIADKIAKEYFFSTLIFLVSLVSVNYKLSHILAFCLVLILFMYFFVEQKPKKYLILSLFFLIVPWVMWSGFEGLFWIVYLSFIMWGFSLKKWRIYAVVLIGVYFISSPVVSYFRGMGFIYTGHLFSVIAMCLTLLAHFRFKNSKIGVLFIMLLIPLSLGLKLSTMSGSYSIIVEKYLNPATSITIGADILPAAGRKLDIVEMPLAHDAPWAMKIGTGLYVSAEYLKKLIFPFQMGFYYGYQHIEPQNWNHPQSLFSFFVYLILIIITLFFYKKEKLLFFSLLLYLAALSLYSNIVAPLPGLMADRFAYIPSLGFILLLVIALFMAFKVPYSLTYINLKKQKTLLTIVSIIVVLFSIRSFSRNSDWENHLTLFRKDIAYLNNSAQAHNLLATNLIIYSNAEKNKALAIAMKEEAITHYHKALAIYPDFFNAAYDLGRTYYQLKNYDSALVFFAKAINIRSEFYDPYLQTAFIYHQKNNIDLALDYYYKTLELKPNLDIVYKNLNSIYFSQNNFEKVIEINKIYKIHYPEEKEPLINIAKAYFINESYDSAAFYFKEILILDNRDTDAIKALIEVYTKTNKADEVAIYENKLYEILKKTY